MGMNDVCGELEAQILGRVRKKLVNFTKKNSNKFGEFVNFLRFSKIFWKLQITNLEMFQNFLKNDYNNYTFQTLLDTMNAEAIDFEENIDREIQGSK